VPDDVVVPAYPAAARTNRASGDIEVKVAVQRNGKVASAEIGTTRNLVGSTQAIESAECSRPSSAAGDVFVPPMPPRYSSLYSRLRLQIRRRPGVARLGYAASGSPYSPSQARVNATARSASPCSDACKHAQSPKD
jgi:hypothetical protein